MSLSSEAMGFVRSILIVSAWLIAACPAALPPFELRSGDVVAFVGGRVITMRGDEVIDDGVVLVERNRIKAVGRRGEVAVPPGAYVVDAAGRPVTVACSTSSSDPFAASIRPRSLLPKPVWLFWVGTLACT